MRLTLVISTLQAGGAERVLATLANAWAKRGDDVTLITLGPVSSDFYPLDARVLRVGLDLIKNTHGVADRFRTSIRRVSALRQAVRATEPDCVISFVHCTNLLAVISTRGLRCPVVVSERIDPRQEYAPMSVRLLRRIIYPYADAVVVQTKSVETWARQITAKRRAVVIPNPVNDPGVAWSPPVRQTIVAVGRLHRQKGLDLLIEAFARIAPRHPQWSLEIFGEGPERASLKRQIQYLKLSDRVTLRGVVFDTRPHLTEAGLFVMPSRFEGFPNALLEAMACGCPVLATDCPSGPGEIIRHEHDGLLIPPENVTALAEGLSRLMDSEVERRRLGGKASAVLERFGIDRILELWDNLIDRVCDKRANDKVPKSTAKRSASRRAA